MKKLSRKFYLRDDTLQIARDLLGKLLVVPTAEGERVSGMIVETEGYLGAVDKAAHSYGNRRTNRTEIMFGEGGRAYIFFIYGMYFQLNFVVGAKDAPHCVLIRAVEPIEGIELMRERRAAKNRVNSNAKMPDRNLTSGPGKLCIALGIDKTFNGKTLSGDKIWVEDFRTPPARKIEHGKRIGIDYAEEFAEKPWRFWIKENAFVSKTK